ncbi:hypothetical protein [Aphanothece hegewaldii]|uniref:hypothetical protein n=1 Tax=Aphanothece hegewaldii TaxID=1521625 RepID=UPI0015E648D8|nr:hypothetical protein [Aphanothece hegewaldii]
MPKGQKRVKGVPELHDEVKTRLNLTVTPTARQGLEKLAKERELSISELVEKIGRESLIISAEIPDFSKSESNFQDTVLAVQSLPVERCNELPKVSGAYALVNKHGQAWAGYALNLHDDIKELVRQFDEFSPFLEDEEYIRRSRKKYLVFWIECSDKAMLVNFRYLITNTIQKIIIENSFINWLKQI